MLKTYSIDELQVGMYVTQVLEQSGKVRIRSRGLIKSPQLIQQLKTKGILSLEVDLTKSTFAAPSASIEPEKPAPVKETPYTEAIGAANDLYMQAVLIQGDFLHELQQEAPADLSPIKDLSQSLIDSIFDNQDALSCLTMIKDANEYLLEHSLNCSILMAMFCHHLGFDRDTIDEACLAALLMDVGMSALPSELHNHNKELSPGDWELLKTHVDAGVELVEQCGDISDTVLAVIAQHHERIDGSGYPRGLAGNEIHELARMAAIVDTYDAMISERKHQVAVTPAVALKKLSKCDTLDQELVKRFIQCVGVHPVGSLVRLKSGRLGIVSQKNPKDLLSPVIMTFYSVTSGHYNEIKRVDLSKVEDEIVSGVKPDDFKINLPKFFREVFVNQAPS